MTVYWAHKPKASRWDTKWMEQTHNKLSYQIIALQSDRMLTKHVQITGFFSVKTLYWKFFGLIFRVPGNSLSTKTLPEVLLFEVLITDHGSRMSLSKKYLVAIRKKNGCQHPALPSLKTIIIMLNNIFPQPPASSNDFFLYSIEYWLWKTAVHFSEAKFKSSSFRTLLRIAFYF